MRQVAGRLGFGAHAPISPTIVVYPRSSVTVTAGRTHLRETGADGVPH